MPTEANMARLGTMTPNLSKPVPPKRKPDRFKARPDKIPKSHVTKSGRSKATQSRRKNAEQRTAAAAKTWTSIRTGKAAKKAQQGQIKSEHNGVPSDNEEEEPSKHPGERACFFIRKAWGNDPSQLVAEEFWPRHQYKSGTVVKVVSHKSETWPQDILDMLSAFATASKEIGKREDMGKKCVDKILEVTKARLEKGGEELVGKAEEGMIFTDVCNAAGSWSAETGVKID